MPLYSLRFKVETCLVRDQNLTVDFAGYQPVFLFSQKAPEQAHVIAQVEMAAGTGDEAWKIAASSVLPQILDALSFATGTPLLLRDCELVLKDEVGGRKRRGLYIGHRHVPSRVPLRPVDIEETTKILATKADLRLPLCWHRYALDRQLAHEQFVFNWLAFEALAGDTDVVTRCAHCNQELEHCGEKVSHRSSSKLAARQIFQAAHPDTTNQEFNSQIWSKARNYVFHGRRYPEPEYLGILAAHSQKLHIAVDRHIDAILGLGDRLRPHQHYENWLRRFIFFEWDTEDQGAKFASDWPVHHLVNMTDEEDPNGPKHRAAAEDGLVLLNHGEYRGW